MHHGGVGQRLEVRHSVVHIDRKTVVVLEVQGREVVGPADEDHRQVCRSPDRAKCRELAEDEEHGALLVESFEDGDPLRELVRLFRAIPLVCIDMGRIVDTVDFVPGGGSPGSTTSPGVRRPP